MSFFADRSVVTVVVGLVYCARYFAVRDVVAFIDAFLGSGMVVIFFGYFLLFLRLTSVAWYIAP